QFYPNANCQNLGPGNPYTSYGWRYAYGRYGGYFSRPLYPYPYRRHSDGTPQACAAAAPHPPLISLAHLCPPLLPGRGDFTVHHGPAAGADLRALAMHAGGNARNIRDFVRAKPHGVASAHLLGFRGERQARRCRECDARNGDGESEYQLACLADS